MRVIFFRLWSIQLLLRGLYDRAVKIQAQVFDLTDVKVKGSENRLLHLIVPLVFLELECPILVVFGLLVLHLLELDLILSGHLLLRITPLE